MPFLYLQAVKKQDWQPKSLKKLFVHGKGVVMRGKFCTILYFFLYQCSCPPPPSAQVNHSRIGNFKVTNKETLFAASSFCWKRGGTEVKPIHFTNAG